MQNYRGMKSHFLYMFNKEPTKTSRGHKCRPNFILDIGLNAAGAGVHKCMVFLSIIKKLQINYT